MTAHAAHAPDPDRLADAHLPGASKATDLTLLYFTSGTTAYPKMVPRDHAYPLAHTITGRYWMDLGDSDIHWTLSDTGWAKAAWGMFPQWQLGAAVVLYDARGRRGLASGLGGLDAPKPKGHP